MIYQVQLNKKGTKLKFPLLARHYFLCWVYNNVLVRFFGFLYRCPFSRVQMKNGSRLKNTRNDLRLKSFVCESINLTRKRARGLDTPWSFVSSFCSPFFPLASFSCSSSDITLIFSSIFSFVWILTPASSSHTLVLFSFLSLALIIVEEEEDIIRSM